MTIIAPLTVIRLKKQVPDCEQLGLNVGDTFRVGYYNKQDGLELVWLVDANGIYEQAWEQKSLLEYFEVIAQSEEPDIFGEDRKKIGPIA